MYLMKKHKYFTSEAEEAPAMAKSVYFQSKYILVQFRKNLPAFCDLTNVEQYTATLFQKLGWHGSLLILVVLVRDGPVQPSADSRLCTHHNTGLIVQRSADWVCAARVRFLRLMPVEHISLNPKETLDLGKFKACSRKQKLWSCKKTRTTLALGSVDVILGLQQQDRESWEIAFF